jgi:hypothetical protein
MGVVVVVLLFLGLSHGVPFVESVRIGIAMQNISDRCVSDYDQTHCVDLAAQAVTGILGQKDPDMILDVTQDASGGVHVVCDYRRPVSLPGFSKVFHYTINRHTQGPDRGFTTKE